jgi:hypothetical protein
MFWRRYAVLVVSAVLAVPAFFGGAAIAHNVDTGTYVFRSINTQFGTFCAEDEAVVLHPGIYGLVYSTWGKTYDRTGLFCATPYAPPSGQIYVSQVVYQTYLGNVYLCGSSSAYNASGAAEAVVAIAPCNFGTTSSQINASTTSEIWWNNSWTPAGVVTATHNG